MNALRVAALFVQADGVYSAMPDVDPWPEARVAELEGRLKNVVAEWRGRSADMPTNGYYNASADLSESETLGGCADEIDAVLAKREGGR